MSKKSIQGWAIAFLAVLAGVGTASLLAGCHTVKGIGHDITAVGQGGQDMIDDMGGKKREKY